MPRRNHDDEREEDVRFLGDDSLSSGMLCDSDEEPRDDGRARIRDSSDDARGFFDRLTDQVYAWMGDEDARYRRARDRGAAARRRH
jgi:hypothetical protein